MNIKVERYIGKQKGVVPKEDAPTEPKEVWLHTYLVTSEEEIPEGLLLPFPKEGAQCDADELFDIAEKCSRKALGLAAGGKQVRLRSYQYDHADYWYCEHPECAEEVGSCNGDADIHAPLKHWPEAFCKLHRMTEEERVQYLEEQEAMKKATEELKKFKEQEAQFKRMAEMIAKDPEAARAILYKVDHGQIG